MSGSGPEIRVFPDSGSVSRAAAGFIVSLAERTIASRNRFTFALSGGSTPKELYGLLASSPYREEIAWHAVHLFWADERCVPPDHPESNYKMARETLLSGVPVPDRNIHRIRGEEDPCTAAREYENDLRTFFGSGLPAFDLVLLGAGEDGHTASLFPASASLLEKKRLALPISADPPKLSRVTITLPVLNNAHEVLFLAIGRRKAGILHEIMEDGNPKGYPAGLVQPVHGVVTWIIDHQAAGALAGTEGKKLRR